MSFIPLEATSWALPSPSSMSLTSTPVINSLAWPTSGGKFDVPYGIELELILLLLGLLAIRAYYVILSISINEEVDRNMSELTLVDRYIVYGPLSNGVTTT